MTSVPCLETLNTKPNFNLELGTCSRTPLSTVRTLVTALNSVYRDMFDLIRSSTIEPRANRRWGIRSRLNRFDCDVIFA
jgi:hypothetical protein